MFGRLGTALSSFASKVVSCVSSIGAKIGGVASRVGSLIGSATNNMISVIGPMFPKIGLKDVLHMVGKVISGIAEFLGLKETDKDEPEELAMKAEKDPKKPEDYNTTEEYIKHLQKDIEITKEEKERFDKMSEEEKAAYKATGIYIYTKGVNEKLGFDHNGLKDPTLIGVTAKTLGILTKLNDKITPEEFVAYSKHLQANELSISDFSDYIENKTSDIEKDKKIQDSITEALKEINPEMSEDDLDQKLFDLSIEG